MSRSSRRTYHTGLTREAITEAAVALTAERGLDGWSMRDLTSRLDTSLSVIYHHIGDREHVCAAAIDKIFSDMSLPLEEAQWRRWLHGFLLPMIDHLAHYPGVAAWLLRNGPQIEQLLPTLETGMSRMLDAGFGDEAAYAYSFAFNSCLGLIALGDQQPRDNVSGLVGLERMIESSPATGSAAGQMQQLIARFTGDSATRESARREYNRYALDRILDGLQTRLHELTNRNEPD
ncbi:TetR/AcrR family transcriptional regulator [Nocardia donostiensis]|uniref:HTH tetR-type domain-containing protein n=1 Tax=Nocardia donostiensis TaxID=1538463 RepID=A0A1V2TCR9_9NOCA|nr:TetR/AcrR family transcriptional regulator [Nocardia donostiensis]ONM47299.1 hypothetical protein B0T46_18695 [Nocardia donostiensis]OQS16601.1 hypothetical protein B0T36_02645 [Nocardia donostiensis]OQS21078.1 hypothetical protein B0T44_08625 [Nocardia donostiensis]